jgi:uncharacterized protein YqfA (UPF0365 family)
MIKQVYNDAINKIEACRQQQIEAAKAQVMREKIVPFNAEIDTALRAAIQELTARHNEKTKNLQADFNMQKQSLIEAAEQKKKEFAATAMEIAVSVINKEADCAIANLASYIGKQGE